MRIALATGLLPVPPTYFALQHAARLAGEHRVRMFALAADIRDPSVGVEVDAVVPSMGPWTVRIATALMTAPVAADVQARRIEAFTPDVVHQHFATWSRGAIAGAGRAHAPMLATIHGYDVFALEGAGRSPLREFHRRSALHTARSADRLLAVSRYLADRAVAAGFPANRLHVHYQGIDTDIFRPESVPLAPGERSDVVFIGALAERKGVEDLLRASIELAPRVPHRLLLIGDGPLRDRVAAAEREHPHIRRLGSLGRDRVLDALRRARLLVLPTQEHRGWREAAGLVLLEAQACGVPVVAYRSGGAPEMLDEGVTGRLVDERDVAGLAKAVADLLSLDDAGWVEMSADARRFVVVHRSLTGSVHQLLMHYQDLTGGSGSPADR